MRAEREAALLDEAQGVFLKRSSTWNSSSHSSSLLEVRRVGEQFLEVVALAARLGRPRALEQERGRPQRQGGPLLW